MVFLRNRLTQQETNYKVEQLLTAPPFDWDWDYKKISNSAFQENVTSEVQSSHEVWKCLSVEHSGLTIWSFAHQTQSSAVSRSGGGGKFSKMFLWTGSIAAQGSQYERRTVYQKIRAHSHLDKRKTNTALKAGEDRAILLGLTMIMCSVMLYFILGITIFRSYMDSIWTEESWCTVLNSSNIGDMTCTFSCGSDCYGVSKYPCLQVFVILNSSGEVYRLSHTEETLEINPECFYVPKCKKTCNMTVIEKIAEYFKKHQQFPCFHDRERKQENVLLTRLYGPSALFHSLFWPTCMLIGGTLIIAMVKLTQYLSLFCEGISKIKR